MKIVILYACTGLLFIISAVNIIVISAMTPVDWNKQPFVQIKEEKTCEDGWENLGQKFCGLRGGLSFKEVLRPNAYTFKCPNDTVACSNKTTIDNTICYHLKELCPVTGVKIQSGKLSVSRDEQNLPLVELSVGNDTTVVTRTIAPQKLQCGHSRFKIIHWVSLSMTAATFTSLLLSIITKNKDFFTL